MNSHLLEEYIKDLNKQMARQGRNIILFLDNAPSHPMMQLSNVTLKFLPLNTTSVIQPMDQGIIRAFKLKYRKRQMQYVISQMELYPSKGGQNY